MIQKIKSIKDLESLPQWKKVQLLKRLKEEVEKEKEKDGWNLKK